MPAPSPLLPLSLTQAIQGSGGEHLSDAPRAHMERALDSDLSGVRIHTGSLAARAAKDINARAFTVGQDVYFGAGQYELGTKRGAHLLAHELTHTMQQADGRPASQEDTAISSPGDPLERDAEAVAERVSTHHELGRSAAMSAPRALAARSTRDVRAPAESQFIVHRAPVGSAATAEPKAEVDVLGPGELFRWIGNPSSPTLAVRTSWLIEKGVRRGTPRIAGRAYPRVMRPVIEALTAFCTWADHDRAMANVADTALYIDSDSWTREQVLVPVASSIFTVVGLPKDAPVQLVHATDGVRVYVDLVRMAGPPAGTSGATGVAADGGAGAGVDVTAVAAAIIAALEAEFARPVTPLLRQPMADALATRVPKPLASTTRTSPPSCSPSPSASWLTGRSPSDRPGRLSTQAWSSEHPAAPA